MNDNAMKVALTLGAISAAAVLIITGNGVWVIAVFALVLTFVDG